MYEWQLQSPSFTIDQLLLSVTYTKNKSSFFFVSFTKIIVNVASKIVVQIITTNKSHEKIIYITDNAKYQFPLFHALWLIHDIIDPPAQLHKPQTPLVHPFPDEMAHVKKQSP